MANRNVKTRRSRRLQGLSPLPPYITPITMEGVQVYHVEDYAIMRIAEDAHACIRAGGTLEQGYKILQRLDDPVLLATEGMDLYAHFRQLEEESRRTLVELFIASVRENPNCDASVHWRPVSRALLRYPEKYNDQHKADVEKLWVAFERLCRRQIAELRSACKEKKLADFMASDPDRKQAKEALLKIDWATVEDVDAIVEDPGTESLSTVARAADQRRLQQDKARFAF